MVIPFSNLSTPPLYDTDAAAYFAKIATLGPDATFTEKHAVNTLILGLKSASLWTKFVRLYLRSPASFAASLLCAKTLTSMTAVNMTASDWSPQAGMIYDGISKYLRGDTTMSSLAITAINLSGGVWCPNTGLNARIGMGCEHSDGVNQFFIAPYAGNF